MSTTSGKKCIKCDVVRHTYDLSGCAGTNRARACIDISANLHLAAQSRCMIGFKHRRGCYCISLEPDPGCAMGQYRCHDEREERQNSYDTNHLEECEPTLAVFVVIRSSS